MSASTAKKVTDKPLYCFKYDEATGETEKITIPEYVLETNFWTKRKTLQFDCTGIIRSAKHYSVSEGKLDRYVSGKVFSFNSDVQNAKRIILEDITSRQFKAYTEYQKYAEQVEKFLNTNPEFDNQEYGA